MSSHLKDGSASTSNEAKAIGESAVEAGLDTLDLAKVHEEALIAVVSPSEPASVRESMIRRADQFFAEAVTPIELTHRAALETNVHLKIMVDELVQRTDELNESNQELLTEISRRKTLEESLRASEATSSRSRGRHTAAGRIR